MGAIAVAQRSEQRVYVPELEKSARHIAGELGNVTALYVHRGTITTSPLTRLDYDHVRKMRIYGEHDAIFPREGVRFIRDGERPVKSVTTEEHSQRLILGGKIMPSYSVKNAHIELADRTTHAELGGSSLRVLEPTSFSIWAEYISPEEEAFLKAMRDNQDNRQGDAKLHAFLPAYVIPPAAALMATIGWTSYYFIADIIKAVVAFGPGIIYSLSPNVALTFPDGRTDIDTGAQVMRFDGKIHMWGRQPRIETRHFDQKERVDLTNNFSIDGDFFVEGEGNFDVDGNVLNTYGADVHGVMDFMNGKALLAGDLQA